MEGITRAMVSIKGVSPILMHNSQLADPVNEWVKKIKEVTSKHHSKKTEADDLLVKELEFQGGLYHDDGIGPFLPDRIIEGAIRDAARTSRQGKSVESSVMVEQEKVPLIYQGPRDRAGLYEDKRFVDTRAVKLQKSATIMRTRPRFDQWSADFEIMSMDDVTDIGDIEKYLVLAGRLKGLCDYRPKFGRFIVTAFEVI